jgi:hypothetical protein
VIIPINVTNFNNVGAISLTITYSTDVVTFVDAENPNGVLPGGLTVGTQTGIIKLSWYDATTPRSIGTGTLINLKFTYRQAAGRIAFSPNPGDCEITDGAGTSYPVTYQNGYLYTGPAPTLTVNPTSLSFGSVLVNTTSAEQTYIVTGSNLLPTGYPVMITAPTGYQVSFTSGSGFASSINVDNSGGSLAAKTVYTRFAPTVVQSYNGNIVISGSGATVNETVSGNGVLAAPALTSPANGVTMVPTSTTLSWGAVSGAQTYDLQVSTSSSFSTIFLDNISTGTSAPVSGLANGTTYYWRVRATTSSQTPISDWSSVWSFTTTAAVITVNPTTLTFGNIIVNTTSSQQAYTVTGTNLNPTSSYITIAAPTGFQVSTTSGTGFASSITVGYGNGTISAKPIYVRFAPTAAQSYSGNITNGGGGGATTVNVAVSGTAIACTLPGTPTYLTAIPAACGTGTINVSWTASSGDSSYTLSDYNGSKTVAVYTGPSLSFAHTGLVAGSPHGYSIRAYNSCGPSDGYSEIPGYIYAPPLCVPPPTVSMSVSPESGTQVGSADVTIHYSVNQVASVSIYVDWLYSFGDYLSGSNQWTTTLSAGTHTIYIYAGNNNGGNSVSITYNVLYPPAPPSISNLTVTPAGNNNYTVSFSVESYNQQVSTDLYVDVNCCDPSDNWQNMGGDFSSNIYLTPGTTHQILVKSMNNYGEYNEAYASVNVPPPPPPAPAVYILGINQSNVSLYDVTIYILSGNQWVNIYFYVDGNLYCGWQTTGGEMSPGIYLEPGTHEICIDVQNTYGNNEACTSIEVLPPSYPAPTISQFITSLTTYGTVIVNFYVDSDNQPVDIKLYYGNSYDEWQNTGGYISDEISAASIPDNILDVEVSNAYGQNEQTVCPLESKPGSIAAHKPIVLKESSVSGTTNSNGNFVKKNVDILSSKSASFNSSNNATSTLSGGSSIVVTSNKNLPRKNIINILSANVKKDVASNQIGTYTVMREIIEHTWDIKSNQDKKAFISLECPSLDIQSNKGNQKAVKFKNDIQDKNASFDMGISKGDTISTRFKISYSHLNAFGIKMSKGIEFKITVDANGSNGTYQASIKEPLSGQETDSLGIARLDNAIKWVVPKDMKSVRIVPSITENIIDSSLKVNIVYEIISSQDSIGKNQASLGKGVQIYQETKVEIPTVFAASQNYPNPFNPSTVIRYQLPAASFVKLVVYDIMGREVAILAEGMKNTGYYTSTFDGSRFASGIYFARLTAMPQDGSHPFVKVMKMSMMK